MRTFGLLGYPLSHSFSKSYFTEKFSRERITDARYENFEVDRIDKLGQIIARNPNLRGLNVTIPYKEAVIEFLDELDIDAKAIGAVNTVKISSGKLKGFNTDCTGFMRSLIPLLKPFHKKALILGTGGSSKAVRFALKKLGIEFLSVSRNPSLKNEIGYSFVTNELVEKHTVIINTTPVGMFPEIGKAPDFPYHRLTPKHLLYDLIYNPDETLFLKRGKENGTAIKNGYEMLLLQAEESWRIWNSFGLTMMVED